MKKFPLLLFFLLSLIAVSSAQTDLKKAQPDQPANYPEFLDDDLAEKLFRILYGDKTIDEFAGINGFRETSWKGIEEFLSILNDRAKGDVYHQVFFNQLYGIGDISYRNRQVVGGWAGDFTLLNFRIALKDMSDNQDLWGKNDTPVKSDAEWVQANKLLVLAHKLVKLEDDDDPDKFFPTTINTADKIWQSFVLPFILQSRHVDRHLKPAFEFYIRGYLRIIAANSEKGEREKNLVLGLINLRKEHELFIEKAVIPAFEQNAYLQYSTNFLPSVPVLHLNFYKKKFAELAPYVGVPATVRRLRRETIETELDLMVTDKFITQAEATKIKDNQDICKCIY